MNEEQNPVHDEPGSRPPQALRERLARAQALAYPRGTSPTAAKQGIHRRIRRRLARNLGRKQKRFNIAAVDAMAAINTRIEELAESLHLLRSHVGHMDRAHEQLAMSVNHELVNLRPALAEIARERVEDRSELTAALARLRAQNSSPELSVTGLPSAGSESPATPNLQSFYEGFEYRFRGSREIVRTMLAEYLPEVAFLGGGEGMLLDIGPGRGEWLELLGENDIRSYGIDVNDEFVRMGVEHGLDVRLGDAISHLRELPEQSLGAVTAFHVVEHFPFETIVELVDQSLRVLRSGGVIILETPNPLTLTVGAAEFWRDPTHIRPIHPQLLEYLLINRGYTDVEVRFLHPARSQEYKTETVSAPDHDRLKSALTELHRLLYGPMDYAVLARSERRKSP